MSLTRPALGALALVAAMAASSATPVARPDRRAATAPGNAPLMVFGGRSAAQLAGTDRKLDAALAELVRRAPLARPAHALEDLRSFNPAARFYPGAAGSGALVAVDALAHGDPQQLKQALAGLGMQHIAVYGNDVGGLLPVAQLSAAAARLEVRTLRAALSRTRTGPVTSQGDFAQGSSALRAANSQLTGSGITVGVISDSFNCFAFYAANPNSYTQFGIASYTRNGYTADAAQDEASGALPASVTVVQEADCVNFGGSLQLPFTDEGRAMLQIVHDVAPGAGLAFYSAATSEADFANGVRALAAAGAKVEADDLGFFDEPFFQDGIITQAIDSVVAQGVAYFTAAGNDGGGALGYENTAPSFSTLSSSPPNSGEMLLNFDTSGATTTVSLPITIAPMVPGEFAAVVVEWDQPYATSGLVGGGSGATSQIDLCLTNTSGTDTIINLAGTAATCTTANQVGADPVQILVIGNPANANANTGTETMTVQIGLANGSSAPGRIKVVVEDDGAGSSINGGFNNSTATIQGHSNAANAGTVGAAFYGHTPNCGVSPASLEPYSSAGGAPVLFDASGNAQTAVTRQKPDFVGPDGVNDTFLGAANFSFASGTPQCQANPSFPSFFGTSAATPHVAALAALLMQFNTAITPAQVYAAMRTSAAPMGPASPNLDSGYGFIQAQQAFAQVPAPAMSAGGRSGGGASDVWMLLALAALAAGRALRGVRPACAWLPRQPPMRT